MTHDRHELDDDDESLLLLEEQQQRDDADYHQLQQELELCPESSLTRNTGERRTNYGLCLAMFLLLPVVFYVLFLMGY